MGHDHEQPIAKGQGVRRRLLARLALLELGLTGAELAIIAIPLLRFFPPIGDHPELGWLAAALILVWTAAAWRWLAPIRRRPRDGHADEATVCARIRLVPGRLMVLRLALWTTVGLAAALWLTGRDAITAQQATTAVIICIGHSFGVAVIRLAVLMPLLRQAVRRLGLREGGWLVEQADTLFDRLTEIALVVGAASVTCSVLFIYLYVPMTQEQFLRLETYFPLAGTALGFIWYYGVAPRQIHPLAAALRSAPEGRLAPAALRRAGATAHRLPATLAWTKLGFFSTGAAVMFVESALLGFSLLQATFLSLAILLVAVGFAIYEFIWSHALLRPITGALLDMRAEEEPDERIAPARGRPLSRKLLATFGGVTLFAVLLALFWAYLLHGNLRSSLAIAQAHRELKSAVAALQPAVRGGDPGRIARRLAALRPVAGSRYVHVRPGPAAPPRRPAKIPADVIATVRRQGQGDLELELADRGLAGAYRWLDPQRPALGSLLVLVPTATGGRAALGVGSLVLFFGVVLALSLGLVLSTSAGLTRPLAELEQAATRMAAGELERPVRSAGAASDEIGTLTAAFEQMRRRLKDKIEAVERLNLTLEEKVRERTGALASSNEELRATLEALTEAQQQLVVSERMAAVGQLVAGIAHEINNPINAVSNMIDPLATTVDDLLEAARRGERDGELEGDLQKILGVFRSGTSRTKTIVSALRNYARGDAEQPRAVDLHADIEESLTLIGHRLRGVEVQRELRAEGPLVALRGRLNQALLNLLANAADAVADRDDGRIAIRTRGAAADDAVTIEVEDNGPGVPEALRARVFDPFFTTKDVGQGTGLGLSISHRIATEHGGRLELSSRPGETIFTLTLPRAPCPA